MDDFGRKFATIVLALAIWTVSATCTSGGCLMAIAMSKSTGGKLSCCATVALGQPSSNGQRSKHCPVCGQPLTNDGGDVHQASGMFVPYFSGLAVEPIAISRTSPLGISKTGWMRNGGVPPASCSAAGQSPLQLCLVDLSLFLGRSCVSEFGCWCCALCRRTRACGVGTRIPSAFRERP